METLKIIDEKTLSVFVPMEIKKKSGAVQIILTKNIEAGAEVGASVYDPKMMIEFAKTYKWKRMLKSSKVRSLADICNKRISVHHIPAEFTALILYHLKSCKLLLTARASSPNCFFKTLLANPSKNYWKNSWKPLDLSKSSQPNFCEI